MWTLHVGRSIYLSNKLRSHICLVPVLIALSAEEAGGDGLVQRGELAGGRAFHNPVHLHKSRACWFPSRRGCPAVVRH